MKWLSLVGGWILAILGFGPKPYRTLKVEDLPERLLGRTVYLVGEGEHLWVAAMVLPVWVHAGDSTQSCTWEPSALVSEGVE